MTKLQEVQNLYNQGKALLKAITETIPNYRRACRNASGYGKIDKHYDEFSHEDSIQSPKVKSFQFRSFTGSYGSSSTYSDLSGIDSDLFDKYFIKYLNKNKDTIVKDIASLMIEDARAMKKDAEEELRQKQTELDAMDLD